MIPEINDTLRENRSSFGINSFALVFLTRLIAFHSSGRLSFLPDSISVNSAMIVSVGWMKRFTVCAVHVPLICCLPSIFIWLDMFSIGAVGGCYGGWKWTCGSVIPPFLTGCIRRTYAAIFSFMAGVMPPMPMLGRSLL